MRTLLALVVVAALSACSDDVEPAAAAPTATVTVTATATETVTASSSQDAPTGPKPPELQDPEPDVMTSEFPEDVERPEHGGRYFAVALAAEEPFLIVESTRAVGRYGYHAGVGSLGCLAGSADAYQLPSETIVSYLLFPTLVAAYRFTDAYAAAEDGTQLGIAEVTTYCLD